MSVLTRLREYRRAAGLVLVALTALGAGSATLHNHPDGCLAEEPGLLAHVPVSVIDNPDARSAAIHLHPGSTVSNEPCAACVLSGACADVVGAAVPTPIAPCSQIAAFVKPAPAARSLVCADSRSPPAAA